MIEKGANVNQLDKRGFSPVFVATGVIGFSYTFFIIIMVLQKLKFGKQRGYLELVKLLIRKGANVNLIVPISGTPLHDACRVRFLHFFALVLSIELIFENLV